MQSVNWPEAKTMAKALSPELGANFRRHALQGNSYKMPAASQQKLLARLYQPSAYKLLIEVVHLHP